MVVSFKFETALVAAVLKGIKITLSGAPLARHPLISVVTNVVVMVSIGRLAENEGSLVVRRSALLMVEALPIVPAAKRIVPELIAVETTVSKTISAPMLSREVIVMLSVGVSRIAFTAFVLQSGR